MAADYRRREITQRRVEFVLPMKHPDGINWTDLMRVIHVATNELRDNGQLPPGWNEPGDNQLLIVPGGEDVVVRYYVEEAVSDG